MRAYMCSNFNLKGKQQQQQWLSTVICFIYYREQKYDFPLVYN